MSQNLKAIKDKIRQIQRADNKTKKTWLIILSAISMTFILLLWVVYVSLMIPSIEAPESYNDTISKNSLFTNVGRGLKIITSSLKIQSRKAAQAIIGGAGAIKDQINKSNDYTFEKP